MKKLAFITFLTVLLLLFSEKIQAQLYPSSGGTNLTTKGTINWTKMGIGLDDPDILRRLHIRAGGYPAFYHPEGTPFETYSMALRLEQGLFLPPPSGGTNWFAWDFALAYGNLFIHNVTNDRTDLFINMSTGDVGIGMISPTCKLDVAGKVRACEVLVEDPNGWCDYVFEEDYELRELSALEEFIKENKHLPDVPSEKTVLEEGINLGQMDAVLLKKVEELTLYILEQDKRIKELETKLEQK